MYEYIEICLDLLHSESKIEYTILQLDIYISNMNPANEIDYGAGCLGIIWENIAIKIVNEAIRVYNATPEQAEALKQSFLKKGLYKIEILDAEND